MPTINIEPRTMVKTTDVAYRQIDVERRERRYTDRIYTEIKTGISNPDDFKGYTLTTDQSCVNGQALDTELSEFAIVDADFDNVQTNLLADMNDEQVVICQADINSILNNPYISKFLQGNSAVPPYVYPFISVFDSSYANNTRTAFDDIRFPGYCIPRHAATLPFPISGKVGQRIRSFAPQFENDIIEQTYLLSMCAEDFKDLTAANVNRNLFKNPTFKTNTIWQLLNWTIANGRASTTYNVSNHMRYLFDDVLPLGKFYKLEISIYGNCSLNTDTELKIYATSGTYTQLYLIGTVTPLGVTAGQVASVYTFHFEQTDVSAQAIEFKLETTATGGGTIGIVEASLTESVSIPPIQQLININGNRGVLKRMTRNTRTGITEITIKTPDTWR